MSSLSHQCTTNSSNQYSSISHIFYARPIKIFGYGWYTWWYINLNSSAVPWATSGDEILWYTFDSNGDTTYVENFQLATGIKFGTHFQCEHALLVEMKSQRICIVSMYRHLLFMPKQFWLATAVDQNQILHVSFISEQPGWPTMVALVTTKSNCARGTWLLGGIRLSRLLSKKSMQ